MRYSKLALYTSGVLAAIVTTSSANADVKDASSYNAGERNSSRSNKRLGSSRRTKAAGPSKGNGGDYSGHSNIDKYDFDDDAYSKGKGKGVNSSKGKGGKGKCGKGSKGKGTSNASSKGGKGGKGKGDDCNLIITELASPVDNIDARYVEIFSDNCAGETIVDDFKLVVVEAGVSSEEGIDLEGMTIGTDGFLVICSTEEANDVYACQCDFIAGEDTPVDNDGDKSIAIVLYGEIHDIYGEYCLDFVPLQ